MAYDFNGAIQAGANPQDVMNYMAQQTGYNASGAVSAGAKPADVMAYMAAMPAKSTAETPQQKLAAAGAAMSQMRQAQQSTSAALSSFLPNLIKGYGAAVGMNTDTGGTTTPSVVAAINSGRNPAEKVLRGAGSIAGTLISPITEAMGTAEQALQGSPMFQTLASGPLSKLSDAGQAILNTEQAHPEGTQDVQAGMNLLPFASDGINAQVGAEAPDTGPSGPTSQIEQPPPPPPNTAEPLSPANQATVDARTSTYNTLASKYASVDNAIQAGKAKGFDPISDLAQDDRFTPEIDKDGRIDSSQAVAKLNAFVKPWAALERQSIEQEGITVPFEDFKNAVMQNVQKYLPRGASYQTILNRVQADMSVYGNPENGFVDQNGNISGTALDDIKNAKYSISNWNDEDAQISDKTVARAARDSIYENTENPYLKQLNGEMSRYYSARDVLDAVDNKIVKGGRLGKYFARTLGTAVGAHFGPLQAIAGMYIGDALEQGVMQHQFNPLTRFFLSGNDPMETGTPDVIGRAQQMLQAAAQARQIRLALPEGSIQMGSEAPSMAPAVSAAGEVMGR